MGSAEGFAVGGLVVKEAPRDIQGAWSSGAGKEKPQTLKQKNSTNCRRGDKRNSKVQRNRCDSFSLKNGLVGFNSAAGENNFFGLYGLKPDAFDITKYVNELSLDDLLHGRCNSPVITDNKEKTAAKPNNLLLLPIRKASSILQTHKVLQTQKRAKIDHACVEKISTGLVNANSAASQTNGDNGNSCITDLPSQINKPNEILQRLALPPAKDLDLLLSESSKASTSSRYSADPRLGRTVTHRTGLPPFPWSHSFSGHSKLGADSGKLSANRTTCNGRWAKVRKVAVLQKGSGDLMVDFESLTFDKSLVPEVNRTHVRSSDQIEWGLTSSVASSAMNVPSELPSPTYAAAQTLRDMAAFSSKETLKLLKKPSTMKACKLKPIENSIVLDATKSTVRPHNAIKASENGFPSKKPKLSIDVTNVHNNNSNSPTKEPLHCSDRKPFKPPPKKLFRNANGSKYSIDFVKTNYLMKPPMAVDRPSSSSQQKLKKVVRMKWSTPES